MFEKIKRLWRETRGNVIVECCKYIGGATVLKSAGSALWRLFTHAPLYGQLLLAEFIIGLVFLIAAICLQIAKRKPGSAIGGRTVSRQPPAQTQKLKILSAVYGSHETDEVEDVTGTLQRLVFGDTLAVIINKEIFGDPAIGKAKRLQVSYSYDSLAVVKIERRQSDLMVLPEDTFLREQADTKQKCEAREAERREALDRVGSLEAKLALFSPLQVEAYRLARQLRDLLGSLDEEAKYADDPEYELLSLEEQRLSMEQRLTRFNRDFRSWGLTSDAKFKKYIFPELERVCLEILTSKTPKSDGLMADLSELKRLSSKAVETSEDIKGMIQILESMFFYMGEQV
jgi:hypothetical protein